MPVISPNDKVLVTGANGYIALYIVKTLLERGNSVRGTVRSQSKVGHLKELFKSYGEKLEVVVVPDMTKEGAWDDAVKGVQAIEHTATPADFSNPNPEPEVFIEPAIKGTVRVLESALKYKEGIKRIVVTSSIVAIADFENPPRDTLLTEEHWNKSSLKAVEERGAQAGVQTIYSASKVLAERAAWDFYKKHKDEISWDLTTICPPLIIGAPLGAVSSSEGLNVSLQLYWMNVLAESLTREQLSGPIAYTDVRDMAEAHVLALEKEKAGGERIAAVSATKVWQDLVDVANKVKAPERKVSVGFPDIERTPKALKFSPTKASGILGIKYHSIEDTTKSMFEDFAKRGF